MKGDKECEEHNCEALPYCSWHPDDCIGKPWSKSKMMFKSLSKRKKEQLNIKYLDLGYGCITKNNKDGTFDVTIMEPEAIRLEVIKAMNVNVVTK